MPGKKYILTLKNDMANLEKLHSFVEEIQQNQFASKKCLFETNLALEEIFSNVLSYGFNDHADHYITITITTVQGVLNIRIEDDGKPFNPLEAKEPTLQYDIENCALGGLGIHLIKHFMNDIRYKRYQNKNVLTIKKEGCFHERANF
jgi:serine/threonine-protein kinase RsbW